MKDMRASGCKGVTSFNQPPVLSFCPFVMEKTSPNSPGCNQGH